MLLPICSLTANDISLPSCSREEKPGAATGEFRGGFPSYRPQSQGFCSFNLKHIWPHQRERFSLYTNCWVQSPSEKLPQRKLASTSHLLYLLFIVLFLAKTPPLLVAKNPVAFPSKSTQLSKNILKDFSTYTQGQRETQQVPVTHHLNITDI